MSDQQLPKQGKLFGAVSLLNDFASEMVYPLLPAFVTGVLGGGAVALGALDGAADAVSAFVKLFAGRMADRPARRGRLIVIGYLIAAAIRPIIAITAAAWQVVGLRVVDRLGNRAGGEEQERVAPRRDWITRAARPRMDCGIVRPSALAVFRLITSSNLVGCSTGRSPGFAPLRILST